jgi:8-oxo-dGTP pyrophosphatase MutT (NUDIX family)
MRDLITERFSALPDTQGASGGDFALNPNFPRPRDSLTPSAVLVPLVDRPDGMTVLLTQRAAHLSDHPGQVAFPGGRTEDSDDSPVATALRETQEEIGLGAEFIQVVGRLADYETATGFRIAPVVGVVRTGFTLSPSADEVAEVFEVPLAFVLDSANHVRESAVLRGREAHYYVLPFESWRIWGVTAGLLVDLAKLLNAPTSASGK